MLSSRISAIALGVTLAIAVSYIGHAAAGNENDSTVKGTVTAKGRPLPSGRIFLHLDNDQFVGAKIKDGLYTVTHVPTGRRTVSIEGKGVATKYTAETTTPLVVEVKKGTVMADIVLE